MVTALAALDPVACAELCAGHKAIANASMVRAAIEVLDALEGVIAPSGLFARLVELCPELGPELLQAAAARPEQEVDRLGTSAVDRERLAVVPVVHARVRPPRAGRRGRLARTPSRSR